MDVTCVDCQKIIACKIDEYIPYLLWDEIAYQYITTKISHKNFIFHIPNEAAAVEWEKEAQMPTLLGNFDLVATWRPAEFGRRRVQWSDDSHLE